PFTRTQLSDASRKQLKGVLDDHFDHDLVSRIVQMRPAKKLTKEQVEKIIDEGPYTAKAALKLGLIDRVAYADPKALDAEKVKLVKNYGQTKKDDLDFSNPFSILKLLATPKDRSSDKPKVAVIYEVGPIISGKSVSSLF